MVRSSLAMNLLASSQAIEDCAPGDRDCGIKNNGSLSNRMECKWRVVDQEIIVSEPNLLQVAVEQSCPLDEHGLMHLWQCEDCAKLHRPCKGQYAACQGCCGTPWHAGFRVPTQHSCKEVKTFYSVTNTKKVKCDATSSPVGSVILKNSTDEKRYEGDLEVQCFTHVKQVDCPRIPVKFEFECDQCNIGNPTLLRKCCDKGLEWIDSDAMDELRVEGYEPFVWLSGCDTEMVRAPDGMDEFEWNYADDYTNYTKEQIDSRFDTWIEENVCSLLNTGDMCKDPKATTSTTTTIFVRPSVLFRLVSEYYDGHNWYQNTWGYWRGSGSHASTNENSQESEYDRSWGHNGKRWEYDNMKLSELFFECTSSTDPWTAWYRLRPDYQGKTLREIVYGCIPSRGCSDFALWNDGLCSVGDLVESHCDDIPNGCADTLRLGVSDGSPYDCDRDWVLFAVGKKVSSINYNSQAFASVGSYSRIGWCPGGQLTIAGREYVAESSTTSTTTTTCYDYCAKDDRLDLQLPRRLQIEWQSEAEKRKPLAPPVDEMTSCPWFLLQLQESIPEIIIPTAARTTDTSDVNVTAVSPVVMDDHMVAVISLTISGFKTVTAEIFTAVQEACAKGLATALQLPSLGLCDVSLRVLPDSCDFRVGLAVPLSVARLSRVRFDLELAIKIALDMADKTISVDKQVPVEHVQHVLLTQTCHAHQHNNSNDITEDACIQVLPRMFWLPVLICLYL